MRIIDVEESKTNSALLLIVSGIFIILGLTYIENIIGRLVLLISYAFGVSSLKVVLLSSYVFQGLIISGIVYLIITVFRKNDDENSKALIHIQYKHFRYCLIGMLVLFLACSSLVYFTNDLFSEVARQSVEQTDLNSIQLELAGTIISFTKGLLLFILFLSAFLSDKK